MHISFDFLPLLSSGPLCTGQQVMGATAGKAGPAEPVTYQVIFHKGELMQGASSIRPKAEPHRGAVDKSTGELRLAPASSADEVIAAVNAECSVPESMHNCLSDPSLVRGRVEVTQTFEGQLSAVSTSKFAA